MERCCGDQQKTSRIQRLMMLIREDQHLPGCYERLTSLKDCICGGPERSMLIEAWAERQYQSEVLVAGETTVR